MTAKKHGYGRGTIEKRGKKYLVRVRHGRDPVTGKPTRESRVVEGTRNDAENVLAAMIRQKGISGPTPGQDGKLTLHDWIVRHLASGVASGHLSARTADQNLKHWTLYSTPALRATELRRVTTAQLQGFVDDLRKRISPRTTQIVLYIVRAALKAAVKQHVLPATPAADVLNPGGRKTGRRGEALDGREMATALAHDPADRLHALWVTLAGTGMRPGEALGLWWSDVDLERATVKVQRSLTPPKGSRKAAFVPCKADSARVVQLGPGAVTALREHRKRQLEERVKLGERWVNPALVFANGLGATYIHANIANAWRDHLKAAGVRRVRLYDLRHSYGSALVAAGVDIKTVGELMGHRNVTTTLANYIHPTEEQHKAAVAALPWSGAATG